MSGLNMDWKSKGADVTVRSRTDSRNALSVVPESQEIAIRKYCEIASERPILASGVAGIRLLKGEFNATEMTLPMEADWQGPALELALTPFRGGPYIPAACPRFAGPTEFEPRLRNGWLALIRVPQSMESAGLRRSGMQLHRQIQAVAG